MPRKKEADIAVATKPTLISSRSTRSKADDASKDQSVATTSSRTIISQTEREKMISQTAYFRAEKRGFIGGDPVDDWLWAENEVDQHLKAC